MSIGWISLRRLLFGGSWDLSLRLLLVAVVVSVGLTAVGTVVPLGTLVVFQSTIAGVLAGVVLLCTAILTAYTNTGYVIVVVIQFLLLVGLFTSGGVMTFPGASTTAYLKLMFWFALELALISGAIGYSVATTLQRVR